MKKAFLTICLCAACSAGSSGYWYHPPHGGLLVDLGRRQAYLELVLDNRSGSLSGYVLDENAQTRLLVVQKDIVVRIMPKVDSSPLDIDLKAVENPSTGETQGNTSQFRGQDEQLKGLAAFSGTVVAVRAKNRDFRNISFNFSLKSPP